MISFNTPAGATIYFNEVRENVSPEVFDTAIRKGIIPGMAYTMTSMDIGSSYSSVCVAELPNDYFNPLAFINDPKNPVGEDILSPWLGELDPNTYTRKLKKS